MHSVLTSCVTMTPPSDSAATDSGHIPEGSWWSGIWNVSKTVAKSFHPDFDPGQRSDQSGGPWIQLEIQPKELALRLAQKAIPADSYFNTINQVAMACLALASLPGCGGQTSQDHNPGTSKEPPGTATSTSPSTNTAMPSSSSSASSSQPTSPMTFSPSSTVSQSSSPATSTLSSSELESGGTSSSASAMSESISLTSSPMLS
ncbi:hypothetical protein, partial [Endozoicomonas sp. ALC013]|uniref:hypothetical protein n=1 Tax=Endozoicomonas sp. ALC013 TaxID=3403076 RepID=UPI003BB5F837